MQLNIDYLLYLFCFIFYNSGHLSNLIFFPEKQEG